MPVSSEFVELCQLQVALLTQTLEADSAVVYLTERYADQPEAELVPIVAYPEAAVAWQQVVRSALPHEASRAAVPLKDELKDETDRLLRSADQALSNGNGEFSDPMLLSPLPATAHRTPHPSAERLVLPLIHEEVVMGLLVTARNNRPWTEQERSQLDQVSRTLAIARFLDQQGQWLRQTLQQKRLSQYQQSDVFHNLLHQFRNPLTALKTFGKLLVKRFQPEDNSYTLVSGILRESDRLQELLQQFDAAVAVGDRQRQSETDVVTLSLAPVAAREPGNDQPAWETADRPALPLLPASGLGTNLTLEPCSLKTVLSPLLLSASVQALDRKICLESAIETDFPLVLADTYALQEVFTNLLDNALKYAPAYSWVYVQTGLFQVKPDVRYQGVMIADSGPGIPMADRSHIFERHYRGVQAESAIAGTGLGLAIAQALMTQMHGRIEVASPVEQSPWLCEETLVWLNQQAHKSALGPGTAFIAWLPEVSASAPGESFLSVGLT